MKLILKELGKQTEEELSFITSDHAVNYVKELESANQIKNAKYLKNTSSTDSGLF